MSDNPTKYDVLIEQYLRSILDISDRFSTNYSLSGTSYTFLNFIIPGYPQTQNGFNFSYFTMFYYSLASLIV